MLYLLDANVLITAHNSYYPLDRVPEFWGWMRHVGAKGEAKIPLEIYEEIKDGKKDLLLDWIAEEASKEALLLDEEADVDLVRKATEEGYADDLSDDEIEQLGRDPFLLAYALADPKNRTIVTLEVSKPSRVRQNRHLPDVCGTLGISHCDTFEFLRNLNFSTSWTP